MPPGSTTPRRVAQRVAQRWAPAAALALLAAILAAGGWPEPSTLVTCGVLLVVAVCLSPLLFPRSPEDAEARRRASARGVPLIYWRPGCTYCVRLRLALGPLGNKAVWMDVSSDPDASARVRAHNDGNETVPTVFVDDVGSTNPRPAWVREQLLPRRGARR